MFTIVRESSSNFGFAKVAKALANIEDNMAILTYEAFKASLSEAESAFHESTEEVMRKYLVLQNKDKAARRIDTDPSFFSYRRN